MLGTRVFAAIVANASAPISEVEQATRGNDNWLVVLMCVTVIVVCFVTHQVIRKVLAVSGEIVEMAKSNQENSDAMVKLAEHALQGQADARMEICILERRLPPEQAEEARAYIKGLDEAVEVKVEA